MHALILAFALLASDPTSASGTGAPDQATVPADEVVTPAQPLAAPPPQTDRAHQVVCRNEMHAGSRFPVRICSTREALDTMAHRDQDALREIQSHGENMHPDH